MAEPKDKSKYLSDLLILVLDGSAKQEHYIQLNEMLRQSEANRRIYMEFMTTYVGLNYFEGDFIEQDSNILNFDMDLWREMSEYEKVAPTTKIPKEEPEQDLPQKVVYPQREKHKMSRFSQIFLVMNAAAVLFFVLVLKFAPPKGGMEVATLTDSIDAKWADTSISVEKGARLYNNKTPLLLRDGLVEITFDNYAQVTIEGPAEFQILDNDMIKLKYGRVYSQVPPEAYGFQVCTQHAKVIDLGTEFGVKEEIDGDTEIHVFKGQVNLISSVLSKKINVDLLAGSARELSTDTGELKEIPCQDNLFVRQIESETNIIWRGQNLDLADIIGGGNGFGTGKQFSALTLNDTFISSRTPVELMDYRQSMNIDIHSSPFIDSIFIPKGKTRICSQGEIVAEFPDTTGLTFGCVTNGGIAAAETDNWEDGLRLGDHDYGNPGSPMIHAHSNTGVTFNLNQIRNITTDLKMNRFMAICGISETARKKSGYTTPSEVDFWVFVDGVVRFKKEDVKLGMDPVPIDIVLHEDDRFLSLAVTDSDGSVFYDWSIFAKPELKIEPEY